jgi:hypothetical protein
MAVYCVTGRLGAGKTLACVGRLRDALLQGRRVATNLDINIEFLLPRQRRKVDIIRIPDKPVAEDLEAIGLGTPTPDEAFNGIIVLDELGSWLNSRGWSDKSRQPFIDWLIHSRKKGWDILLICQHINQIDKQIRESLVEYHVVCRRLDRMRIPFIGGLIRVLSFGLFTGNFPRMHFGIVRYGTGQDAPVSDRWAYLGNNLYPAYDTRQVFSANYDSGIYSYLSPWHLKGRYVVEPWQQFLNWLAGGSTKLKPRRFVPSRLAPLMKLPIDVRIIAAQRLINQGII